ncbi:MAG: DNA topoisomerase I [Elusimicrobia bacterium]|nr:MAG: DNA topoisomerase I [Elusimicrobiota bacterium]
MSGALVIVESPAKQRTISRFLKKGYTVTSSYGHVRDLPEKKLGVDEEKEFEPTYQLLARTKKLLPELKKLAKKSEFVYLATDHDREGESIAWHLGQILGVPADRFRRITFHEITPTAIQAALEAPREVDMDLVHAQQARRVIDRLVGYKLSPLLWKKIRRGLSAGRVQSVAVRLLVERDAEIKAFETSEYWTLGAKFEKKGKKPVFEARLAKWKGGKVEVTKTHKLFSEDYRVKSTVFDTKKSIGAIEKAMKEGSFKVVSVDRKEVRRRPTPPFITSTLQQAGSQKLGFAAERTMRIAQGLYEGVDTGADDPAGLITYMRTDSVNVATIAQKEAREFIDSEFGKEFLPEKSPVYTGKVKGAQEAHEAIRPTNVKRTPDSIKKHLTPEQFKLYSLIWKRFVASQMKEAVFDTVAADIENGDAIFHATGRTLKFEGFLKVLKDKQEDKQDEEEGIGDAKDRRLPEMAEGDSVNLKDLLSEEHKTSPPPFYNEASLIRALEKHGIGRPSTYAPTIKTVIDRGYVRRGIKDRRLTPSDLGILVIGQLNKHFAEQMDLGYTATVEQQLDGVAEGKDRWQEVVGNFYDPFKKALDEAVDKMEDCRVEPQETDEICPLCQDKMLIRESRFGKYLSCTRFPKCRGKIQLDGDGKKVVPEKTEEVCDLCDKPMVIRSGRKGRFLACSGYPGCKNTYSLDANGNKIEGSRPIITSRPCNKCQSAMWMRLGKRGHFLACSGFPKCRNLKPLSKDDAQKFLDEDAVKRAAMIKEKEKTKAQAAVAVAASGESEAAPDAEEAKKEAAES